MEIIKFDTLGLDPKILRAITEMGFEEPSPIQAKAIPEVMAGHDVIGQAQTGTGKTAAFGIPLLQKIDPKNRKLQAIILLSAIERAFFAFCSTKRTVVPLLLIDSIISKISLTRIGDNPMDGSSIKTIDGFDIKARPIASICCSPPLNVPANWFFLSARRGKRS